MGKFFGRLILFGLPVAIIAGAIFAVGVLGSMRPDPVPQEEGPSGVVVFTDLAYAEDVQLTVRTNGEARPRTEINLVPQVAGRITYVNPNFIEGGFFQAGETLVRIEDADYRLAVVRAQATVAQREQQLAREQAESDLAASEWAELGEGEASPLTLREPQMAEARAALAAARASLQEAQLNLARTRISAPFAGRVRTKGADLGQYVTPGTPLGQVFATDQILVRLPLTDAQLSLLDIPVAYNAADADALPVEFTAVIGGELRRWAGRITRTDSAIDPQTRSVYAIAEIDDPYGRAAEGGAPLAVGLFLNAEITGATRENAVIVPRSALRGRDQVFTVDADNRLHIRDVQVITSDESRVVLAGGVAPGERVVTSPVRAASTGILLRPVGPDGQEIAQPGNALADSENADGEGPAFAAAAQ